MLFTAVTAAGACGRGDLASSPSSTPGDASADAPRHDADAAGVTLLAGPEGTCSPGGDIAVDATYVYWTSDTGAVMKTPIDGGEVTTVAHAPGVRSLALADQHVFFAGWDAADAGPFLGEAPLDGGAPSVVAAYVPTAAQSLLVAASGPDVYWTENNVVDSMPVAGGPRSPVAFDRTIVALAASPAGVFVSVATSVDSGVIVQTPPGGGAAVTLAAVEPMPGSLAVDANRVYVESRGSLEVPQVGTLLAVPLDGGAPATLAAGATTFESGVHAVAVDGVNVYFTTLSAPQMDCKPVPGAILRVPIAGGAPQTLVALDAAPSSIAVDATSVYWTSPTGVFKVTPK